MLCQERNSKNERDLRSLKKRLDKYHSAKEAIFDPFFGDLILDHGTWVIRGQAKEWEGRQAMAFVVYINCSKGEQTIMSKIGVLFNGLLNIC